MPEKKGLQPIAYVGIGCLVMVVIGVIGMSLVVAKCKNVVEDYADNPEKLAAKVAELAIKNDPDLEFVETDDTARTITYRDKKSGKETTISWENAKEGKFSVTSGDETTTIEAGEGTATVETPDGTTTFNSGGGLEKFPAWIEVPEEVTDWKSVMRQENADGQFSGSITGKSKLTPEEVAGLYEKALEASGFTKISKTETQAHAMLNYEHKENQRSLSITLIKGNGETVVNMGYSQK